MILMMSRKKLRVVIDGADRKKGKDGYLYILMESLSGAELFLLTKTIQKILVHI